MTSALADHNHPGSLGNGNPAPMTLSPTSSTTRGAEDRIVRVRAIRACISCRSRKIRCDQVRPACGSCVRGNLGCEYPLQARRPPRPRQPDAVLVQRLARLESVIEELSAGKVKAKREEEDGNGRESQGSRGSISSSSQEEEGEVRTPTEMENVEAGLGRLLVSADGKSRYLGPNFWGSLSTEVADLNSLLHETQDDLDTPDPAPGPLSFFFRTATTYEDLSMYHIPPVLSQHLWDTYVQSVDPLIRIIHKPTFSRKFAAFHRQGAQSTPDLDKGLEAMIFSMYFAAITSMSVEKVYALFGVDKKTMQGRYMIAVEQALANAHFLQSEELLPLQACVLFNSCLRGGKDTRTSWTLVGIVIRIAQSLGLHRDGSLFGMSPFETEMRRRIWYEICILDVRTAEDHGCAPSITSVSYDTLMPLNINDDDLSDDPLAPAPVPRKGFTEMTFCLLRFEVLDCFGFLFRSDPGSAKCSRAAAHKVTLLEKEAKIQETKKTLHEKYIVGLDTTQPLQRVAQVVSKLMMGKALISLYHPLRHFKDGEFLSHEMKERLFITAIENLEYSYAFAAESRFKGYNQWNWFFQKHGNAHAIALTLLELNERAVFDQDGLFERAWAAVDGYFAGDLWAIGQPGGPNQVCLYKPLEKLRDKALKRRRGAEMAQKEVEERRGWEGGGGVVVEDSPIDWNEWDDMFRYVKMDFE